MPRNPTVTATAVGPSPKFGRVALTPPLDAFRRNMNAEMMALFRSLPESVHTDTVVFFMQHFRTPFFPEFNYFRNYPAPAWSIVYWLEQMNADRGGISTEYRGLARRAHAMALFLHPLDDHLHDGQLPATHLHLLLRSQAWWRMNAALEQLAAGVANSAEIVPGFINDYYASIGVPPAVATLDGYCAHFCRQMATWMNVPVLMAAKMMRGGDFAKALQAAYGAFGTAWRLLDDIDDMNSDMASGHHSAVYYLLPADFRQLWDQAPQTDNGGRRQKIWDAIHHEGVVGTLKSRVRQELTFAAAAMEAIHMTGMAQEVRCLAGPLAVGPAAL